MVFLNESKFKMQFKCNKCAEYVAEGEDAMICDLCEKRTHRICLDYGVTLYKNLKKMAEVKWFCPGSCSVQANDTMTLIRGLTNRQAQSEISQKASDERLTKVEGRLLAMENLLCDERLDALESLVADNDDTDIDEEVDNSQEDGITATDRVNSEVRLLKRPGKDNDLLKRIQVLEKSRAEMNPPPDVGEPTARANADANATTSPKDKELADEVAEYFEKKERKTS